MKASTSKERSCLLTGITIMSSLAMICWLLSDFNGGMIFFMLCYGVIVIPFLILYLISVVDFVIELYRKKREVNRLKLLSHSVVLVSMLCMIIYNSSVFKSKLIMKATLRDDLFHYTLVFREDGEVENHINGFLGYQDRFFGKYSMFNDTILFSKIPYDNDFIPKVLLIDRVQNAIFITKDSAGNFSQKKGWLNHFEIEN